MKIENLRAGQRVWDVGRTKMGNTSLSTVGVWWVDVKEVDLESRTVMASWNSNPTRKFREREWKKWRAEYPLLVSSGMRQRLATREEIKAHKEAEAKKEPDNKETF